MYHQNTSVNRTKRHKVTQKRQLKNFIQFVLNEGNLPNRATKRSFKKDRLIEVRSWVQTDRVQKTLKTKVLDEAYIVDVLGIDRNLLIEAGIGTKSNSVILSSKEIDSLILREDQHFKEFWFPAIQFLNEGFFDTLKKLAGKAAGAVKAAAGTASEKLKAVTVNAVKPIKEFGVNAKTVATSLLMAATTKGGVQALAKSFISGAKKVFENVKTAFQKLWKEIQNYLKNVTEKHKEEGTSENFLGKTAEFWRKEVEKTDQKWEESDKAEEARKKALAELAAEGYSDILEQLKSPFDKVNDFFKQVIDYMTKGSGADEEKVSSDVGSTVVAWKSIPILVAGLSLIVWMASLLMPSILSGIKKLEEVPMIQRLEKAAKEGASNLSDKAKSLIKTEDWSEKIIALFESKSSIHKSLLFELTGSSIKRATSSKKEAANVKKNKKMPEKWDPFEDEEDREKQRKEKQDKEKERLSAMSDEERAADAEDKEIKRIQQTFKPAMAKAWEHAVSVVKIFINNTLFTDFIPGIIRAVVKKVAAVATASVIAGTASAGLGSVATFMSAIASHIGEIDLVLDATAACIKKTNVEADLSKLEKWLGKKEEGSESSGEKSDTDSDSGTDSSKDTKTESFNRNQRLLSQYVRECMTTV